VPGLDIVLENAALRFDVYFQKAVQKNEKPPFGLFRVNKERSGFGINRFTAKQVSCEAFERDVLENLLPLEFCPGYGQCL
jgi:hypothetical protein